MEKLHDFINETYTASLTYKENIDERINVCLGNVSCDMDSSIGVFILAYYMTNKNEYYKDPGNYENLFIPVVNCPRGELEARIDIAYHLEKNGINLKKLVYIDDLDLKFYSAKGLLNLSIIDHNRLDITQEYMKDCVKLVVDHHVDTHTYDNNSEVDYRVTFCGSACSMAINLFWEAGLENLLTKEICQFFLPAVLLDTENLKPSLKGQKWGDVDEICCSRIFRLTMNDYFNTLINKKTDRSLNLELGLDLILKKDYKNYQWNNVVAGISVCFNNFHEIINTFTLEKLKDLIIKKISDLNLNLYMIITQTYVQGKAVRELMIFDQNMNQLTDLKEKFEKICPFEYKIKKFTGLSKNFIFYVIQDETISRKKVEPIFKQIFEDK